MAAKQSTPGIPIVFATAGDPIVNGLVASLARPGGNVTGLSIQSPELAGKRLELLREVLPGLRRFAFMVNVDNRCSPARIRCPSKNRTNRTSSEVRYLVAISG
jgi:putative ABC transport system substrate-binding protein